MNRIGFRADKDGVNDAAEVSKLPCFDITGIFSHLACADEPGNPLTDVQIEKFRFFTAALETRGVSTGLKHISASSAVIERPDAFFDMVRPGVMLYGMQPSDTIEPISELGIRPVLSLKSRIINIHRINAGESVSYGAVGNPTAMLWLQHCLWVTDSFAHIFGNDSRNQRYKTTYNRADLHGSVYGRCDRT